jgi:hypothetical protein
MNENTTRMANVVAEALAELWLAEHVKDVQAAPGGNPAGVDRVPDPVSPTADVDADCEGAEK